MRKIALLNFLSSSNKNELFFKNVHMCIQSTDSSRFIEKFSRLVFYIYPETAIFTVYELNIE
jgi:hypothetical protein